MNIEKLRYKVFLSLLASLAIVIHTLESSIPTPFPWLKFGFANIITLTTIVLFGLKAGMTVTLLRVFIGTLLTGTLFAPTFFLSISGSVASTLALAFAVKYFRNLFSMIGISIIGAYTHTLIQVLVAYLILVKHFQVFMLLPVFLAFSLAAGLLSGLGAEFLIRHLKETPGVRKMALSQGI